MRALCLSIETYNRSGYELDELISREQFTTDGFGVAGAIGLDSSQGKIASWVSPILIIRRLESLYVSWCMTASGLRTELDTVAMMRQRMVKGCEQLIDIDELQFRHMICLESSLDPIGQLAQYSPGTGTICWQDDQDECPDYFILALSDEDQRPTFGTRRTTPLKFSLASDPVISSRGPQTWIRRDWFFTFDETTCGNLGDSFRPRTLLATSMAIATYALQFSS